MLAQEAYGHFYAGRLEEAISVARHAQELMRRAPCVGVRAALAAQDRALALCRPDDYTDWALTRLDSASCIARQGDPVTAVKYAIGTIQQLGTEQRQGIISVRGTELARTLPAAFQSSPVARELRDLLHASASPEAS